MDTWFSWALGLRTDVAGQAMGKQELRGWGTRFDGWAGLLGKERLLGAPSSHPDGRMGRMGLRKKGAVEWENAWDWKAGGGKRLDHWD